MLQKKNRKLTPNIELAPITSHNTLQSNQNPKDISVRESNCKGIYCQMSHPYAHECNKVFSITQITHVNICISIWITLYRSEEHTDTFFYYGNFRTGYLGKIWAITNEPNFLNHNEYKLGWMAWIRYLYHIQLDEHPK